MPTSDDMKTIAIDINILLDFFLHREKYDQAERLITQSASGMYNLYIPILVIFEFAWTLKSYYKIEKAIIIDRISAILELPCCEVPDKNRILNAILLYKETPQVSLVDCLIILEAIDNKCADFASSDSKLIKLYAKLKARK